MVGYTPATGHPPRICGCHARTSLAGPNRALHMWATLITTNDLELVFAPIGWPTMVPGVKGSAGRQPLHGFLMQTRLI